MGNGIFYKGKLVATEQSRHVEGDVKAGYQTIYVFKGVKALETIMRAPENDSVQVGHRDPSSKEGKMSVSEFKQKIDQSLAVYPSLESQIANENKPITKGERGRCGFVHV